MGVTMRGFLSLLAACLVFDGVQSGKKCKSYGPQVCFASDAEEGEEGDDEPVPVALPIEKNKKLADIPAMTKEWTVSFEFQQSEDPPKDKWLPSFGLGLRKRIPKMTERIDIPLYFGTQKRAFMCGI